MTDDVVDSDSNHLFKAMFSGLMVLALSLLLCAALHWVSTRGLVPEHRESVSSFPGDISPLIIFSNPILIGSTAIILFVPSYIAIFRSHRMAICIALISSASLVTYFFLHYFAATQFHLYRNDVSKVPSLTSFSTTVLGISWSALVIWAMWPKKLSND